jgi:2-haloacid dehalogenase
MPDAGIDAVVFDIGGVLLDWDPRHLYRKLFDDPAEMDDFLDRICTPRWHLSHDLGADIEASCRSLAARHPGHADLIMAWWQRGEEMIAGQIDGTVTILADLKAAGLRCYALSNMEADRFAVRRRRYPFFELFDGCVISGAEGVVKPDPAIFDLLRTRYGLPPGRTVFIDDNPANVAAAAGLGLVAVEFSAPDRLRRDLRDLGLAVAAGQV